ncbi:serine/threonine protein phosphatase, partial [Streptomyces sp. NPDC057540]
MTEHPTSHEGRQPLAARSQERARPRQEAAGLPSDVPAQPGGPTAPAQDAPAQDAPGGTGHPGTPGGTQRPAAPGGADRPGGPGSPGAVAVAVSPQPPGGGARAGDGVARREGDRLRFGGAATRRIARGLALVQIGPGR